MNQVRIHGDPFGHDEAAMVLRDFLRMAVDRGLECAVSLSGVRPRPASPGERAVPLNDGARDFLVATSLSPAELEPVLRAASTTVAATAPVVVFAPRATRSDAAQLCALEWPRAAAVLVACENRTPSDLVERVRAELRWAGCETPPHALPERELRAWMALPMVAGDGPVVHVGGRAVDGTDLVVDVFRRHFAGSGRLLRVVVPVDDGALGDLHERLAAAGGPFEILRSAFEPAHVRDAVAIVQPWRQLPCSRVLVHALASGRPVCASRFSTTASLLGREGICLPIGGSERREGETRFEPDERAVVAAWRKATTEGRASAAALGRRARRHVGEELTAERPAAPPAPLSIRTGADRPLVVLEAPFFETSSSAELSIETARSLAHNHRVELRLAPTGPFRSDLAVLRRRAPELESLMQRPSGTADLWLSAGWPVRASRPPCRVHALRIDWEYGALPLDLTPHVTQSADAVIVHSEHVRRTVVDAGRVAEEVLVVPHGVDGPMHEDAPPDPEIVQWKRGRPAVLFCGGLIWRKGFDLFLRAVLAARAAGADFCVVVKTVGLDQHYGRFHLGELLERFMATPRTPPVLRIDAELSRERLASVYAACDLMLHPYRGEGFCMPLLEARACGLPVIASSGGAADELLVGPGALGIPAQRADVDLPGAHVAQPWVVEPTPELVETSLLAALTQLAELRRAARSHATSVRARFSWQTAAESIERIAFAAARGQRPTSVVPTEPIVTLPGRPAELQLIDS